MLLILITIRLILLFNIIKIKHPLSIGFFLIIQVIIICLINGLTRNFFWFSYILFLTIIGGLLIIFIYMTRLASNELFFFSYKNLYLNLLILSFIFLIYILYFNQLIKLNYFNNNNFNTKFSYNYLVLNLNKLYNISRIYLTLIRILFLFITLITIIKITNIYSGPLRKNIS